MRQPTSFAGLWMQMCEQQGGILTSITVTKDHMKSIKLKLGIHYLKLLS